MLDRDLSTLVTNVIRRRIMCGDREPDIDLEAGPMSALVARSDHRYATSRDALTFVSRRPISFNIYARAESEETFKRDLWRQLA
jgi:hypothetical protein